jgi:hypothetical protein
LHQTLLDHYLQLFAIRESWLAFWPHFDDGMARWMRATIAPSQQLSDRGSFLRISTAASCLAAQRLDMLTLIDRALDELLVAVVMLDDYFDWRDDVRSGRGNSFVRHCAGEASAAADPTLADALFRRVLRALYADSAGTAFLAGAGPHLVAAARAAEQAGCDGLVRFIEWYRGEVDICGRSLAQENPGLEQVTSSCVEGR